MATAEPKKWRVFNTSNQPISLSLPVWIDGKIDDHRAPDRKIDGHVRMDEDQSEGFNWPEWNGSGEQPGLDLTDRQWTELRKQPAVCDTAERVGGPAQYFDPKQKRKTGLFDTGVLRAQPI